MIMKKKKKAKSGITIDDFIKAIKIGNREAEKELRGPGFHATGRIHKSKKSYSRKPKHKNEGSQDL